MSSASWGETFNFSSIFFLWTDLDVLFALHQVIGTQWPARGMFSTLRGLQSGKQAQMESHSMKRILEEALLGDPHPKTQGTERRRVSLLASRLLYDKYFDKKLHRGERVSFSSWFQVVVPHSQRVVYLNLPVTREH